MVGSDPPPMSTTTGTLCHVFSHESLPSIRKSKGLFGEGRWNAPGGKLKPGEGIEGCAIREVLEEIGLEVRALEPHWELKFHFGPRRDPDWIVHVFSGSLRSGPEGEVRWFGLHEIPYDEMWGDDRYWLPLVFRGNALLGCSTSTMKAIAFWTFA
jgi:8-oxo-dGTP diphosphatase